jgi:hypothetical protein
MSTPTESPRVRTAKAFLDVFRALDTNILHDVLAEDYKHTFGPASISSQLPSSLSKDGFIGHLSGASQLLTTFGVTEVLDLIDSESSNSVWVHCTCAAEFRPEVIEGLGEKSEWEYTGEYVFMFWMDESGEKIARCYEMLDSLATKRMLGLMARASENLAGK